MEKSTTAPANIPVTAQEVTDGSAAHIEIPFVDIKFQLGAVNEVGVNGTQIEDVIDVLVARLQGFQAGDFACRENALAITKLQEALHWLRHRTQQRVEQGVEGESLPHK